MIWLCRVSIRIAQIVTLGPSIEILTSHDPSPNIRCTEA